MNVLIDTQVLIWAQSNPSMISKAARHYLLDPLITKWVSEVSLFEVAIKKKIGKLPEFDSTLPAYIDQVQNDGFKWLPISSLHIIAYDQLPFVSDHRDPFDRLILATAMAEKWPVISADQKFL